MLAATHKLTSAWTRAALLTMVLGASSPQALAQAEAHAVDSPDAVFIATERDEDPLGIDQATTAALATATEPAREAIKPKPSVVRGEILTAIDGVRETSHVVRVELAAGLARVDVEATLSNTSKHTASVGYRLALPADARIVRIAPSAGLQSRLIRDARGLGLSLEVAALEPASEVAIAVRYVSAARVRGGRARFSLPARGRDPRAAATNLRSSAPGFLSLLPNEPLTLDAWEPAQISAALAPGRTLHARALAACGADRCAWSYVARGLAAPVARDTLLLVDASPSMEGAARNRLDVTLGALLATLPARARVHAHVFASRAARVGETNEPVEVSALTEAAARELGNSSRLSSALAALAIEPVDRPAQLVIVSDGRLMWDEHERQALRRARALGMPFFVIKLDDGALASELERTIRASGGMAIDVTHEADFAAAYLDPEPLLDALSPLIMPRSFGVTAGEEERTGRRIRAAKTALDADWSAWLGPPPAIEEGAEKPAPSTSMPAESVLAMLRRELIPAARACLRTDRRGRADYSVGLTFELTFARREVERAQIDGSIEPTLRQCLVDALGALRVPFFSGRIHVRYPIHTEREPPPPSVQTELEPEVAAHVDRILGREALR